MYSPKCRTPDFQESTHFPDVFATKPVFVKVSGQTQGAFHTNFSRWSQQWPLFDQKYMNFHVFEVFKTVFASKIHETGEQQFMPSTLSQKTKQS